MSDGRGWRITAIIRGNVQGVGYRYFAVQRATALGISGYVANLRNDDVKVVAEGEPDNLDQFVEQLKRGPFGAVVRDVIVTRTPATGEFVDFRIEHE